MKITNKNILLSLFLMFISGFLTAFGNETNKIDSLKNLIKTETDAEKIVDTYIDISGQFIYGDADSSLLYARKAFDLSQQVNYKKGEGTALFLISYIFDQSGNWLPAISNLEQAIEIFTQTNDSTSLVACYHNLGVLYSYGKNQVLALKYIIKAKYLSEEMNKNYALSEAYSNIASYYEYLKEYRSSLIYYEKALEVDKGTGNIGNESLSHISLSTNYIKLNRNDEALFHLKEAQKLVPKIADKQRETEVMLGFINYYIETEDLEQAKAYLDKISASTNRDQFVKLAVEIHFLQGKYYLKKKEYKSAIRYFDKAIEKSIELDKFDYLSDYYNEKGKAYAGLKQYEKAYEMISKGDEAFEMLKPDEVIEALGNFEAEEASRAERKKVMLEQELETAKTESDQFKFRVKAALAIIVLLLSLVALSFFLFLRKKHTDELKANYDTINLQKLLLEENLIRLAEDENKLKKLNATKDKFFSIIAHDLKNPFNVLIGISDLLRNEKATKNSDDFDVLIDGMHQAATSGYELLENLLEWSRTQTGTIKFEPQSFFIHKVFEINMDLNLGTAKTKDISIEISKKKAMVYADFDMVNFVVRNLLNNAIKFSNRNGKIELLADKDGEMLIVTVKDNGIGMTPEMIEKLFKIEMSVQRQGTAQEKGTGLGLILCREFVKINGGKIWVESEKDKGTSFHFSLPLSLS
ncbi:tetratricopeptide repeat-containing sensor histidine kinase [Draconibacterium sp. IB214405]|uniref:ATP-binding protein n=1 Tax=Draconibacterium sp. IB214405 TaxID=3097352 RepID=UPI002A0DD4C5|nr:tetratricopeptide repeat-containing sensor histidine kinase [Draconibacterium sp. IB214405]MDX8337714.1 tetratricopeptide repeat-containing sensor histidine kinase [Draconibacterium sp. IB214405]